MQGGEFGDSFRISTQKYVTVHKKYHVPYQEISGNLDLVECPRDIWQSRHSWLFFYFPMVTSKKKPHDLRTKCLTLGQAKPVRISPHS